MTNRKGCSTQREEIEKECRRAVKEFQRVFGRDAKPEFGSYAPGRVNLMGGSIDYSGGPVIPVVSLWVNRLNNVVPSTDLATVKQLGLLTTYPDYSLNGLRGYGVRFVLNPAAFIRHLHPANEERVPFTTSYITLPARVERGGRVYTGR